MINGSADSGWLGLILLQIKGYPSLKVVHKAEEYKSFKGSRDLPHLKAFVEEAAAELTSETN